MSPATILTGDCREALRGLPEGSARCCVTSPPYWGLRDYGCEEQIGLETSIDDYVGALVETFAQVRRVLTDDGTLWLNLGDSYSGSAGGYQGKNGQRASRTYTARIGLTKAAAGMKPKDLVGVPWMVAFALRADGWFLRSEIIWHKPNAMPESIRDRPTRAHETIFLLSKSRRYFYDERGGSEEAVSKVGTTKSFEGRQGGAESRTISGGTGNTAWVGGARRNRRSVWSITTKPTNEHHFATFPPDLVAPCIAAGSAPGDLVVDPFSGTATTGLVALRLGRRYLGVELNPAYAEASRERLRADAPLLNRGVA